MPGSPPGTDAADVGQGGESSPGCAESELPARHPSEDLTQEGGCFSLTLVESKQPKKGVVGRSQQWLLRLPGMDPMSVGQRTLWRLENLF